MFVSARASFACVCVFPPARPPARVLRRPLAADKLKGAKQPINSFGRPRSPPPRSSLSQQYHSCQLTPSNASYLSPAETCPPTHTPPSPGRPFYPSLFLSTPPVLSLSDSARECFRVRYGRIFKKTNAVLNPTMYSCVETNLICMTNSKCINAQVEQTSCRNGSVGSNTTPC